MRDIECLLEKYEQMSEKSRIEEQFILTIRSWLLKQTDEPIEIQQEITENAVRITMQIAYIEQEVFLFNTAILDNILLGKEYDEHTLEKVLEYSALQNDIRQFENGLETIVGENGNKLSGGQRQRIAVARALYHDCSFLLMDEGTSALDKENARIIEESLLNNKELTLILISHNLSEEQKRKFDVIYQI